MIFPTQVQETNPRRQLSPFLLRSNERMCATKRDNSKVRQTRNVQNGVHWGKGLNKIGLGKWMRKTLDLDESHSFQFCLHSPPALDGWSAWSRQTLPSSRPWQPCLFVRPSAQAPKVLYVRALPQPMSLRPPHPTYPLLILLTLPFSMVYIFKELGSHRESPKKDMLCFQVCTV